METNKEVRERKETFWKKWKGCQRIERYGSYGYKMNRNPHLTPTKIEGNEKKEKQ